MIVNEMARGKGRRNTNIPQSTLVMATMEPTARSMPPVRMTRSMPRLRIPMPETCLSKLAILLEVKNTSETMDDITIIIMHIRIVLYSSRK
jgi:hypothetical protein